MRAVGAHSCVTQAKQGWPALWFEIEMEGGLLVLFLMSFSLCLLLELPSSWSLIPVIEANALSLSGHFCMLD